MDATRWRQVEELFAAAVARPADERAEFLDSACAGDPLLRAELDSMLAHDRDDGFLDVPAVGDAARLLAGPPSLVGGRVGRFEVVEQLGAGGMGEVYLALDPRLERRVALKLVRRDLAADPERADRFRREALAASALNHPNILTVHEIDSHAGADVLVSELVDGTTLRDRLREGPLPAATALDVALQAARGLAAAHAAGIVHRDVKPENLMIRADGLVKILDFGVAQGVQRRFDVETGTLIETAEGRIVGTLSYMSPEQARGLPVDARTDVWSLAVVLYELVTGEAPFPGATPSDRLVAILQHDPTPPSALRRDLPAGLDRVVTRALSKDPAGRQADAGELATELAALSLEGGGSGELAAASDAPPRPGRRSAWGGIAALAVLLVAGLAVWRGLGLAASPRLDSLAVLPLVDGGGDAELAVVGEGIADSLIRSLARTPGLRVVARWSSFPYRERRVPARQIARELGVEGVVTGRVARRGEHLVVSFELIDAEDDAHAWGEEYERDADGLVTLHEEVAREIRRSLGMRSESTPGGAAAAREPDPEAYRLYLRGRYHWNRSSSEDFHASRDFFQRAIERDPDFALAWAGLSHYYSFGAANGILAPGEFWPRAEQTARRALALDPSHPEVYNALAGVPLYRDRDWRRGEALLERGLALGESAELLNHYALYLGVTGRTEQALRMGARARAVDPGRDPYRLASALYYGRRPQQALEPALLAVRLDPTDRFAHGRLAGVLVALGRHDEAIAALSAGARAAGTPEVAEQLERTHRTEGFAPARAVAARHRLASLEQRRARGEHVTAVEMAMQHLLAGDRAEALAWSARAFQERNRLVLFLATDPTFDPLRDDPGFRAGVDALKLPG